MRESLTVNVEKHSQQITCQSSKMLDILLSRSLGNSPLKNQIITIRLQRQNSLVRLDQSLQSPADIHPELGLLIEDIREQLRKSLVERFNQVQRQLTVTREGSP